jgi:hypothetical protein
VAVPGVAIVRKVDRLIVFNFRERFLDEWLRVFGFLLQASSQEKMTGRSKSSGPGS